MQKGITFGFVVITVYSLTLTAGRPQNNFNNYPFRPTFSDLDWNYYYTTASPYQQNYVRIWPYIIDQAVSPLYNWRWNNNGYNNGYSPYNWFNNNNAYNNFNAAATTANPYLSVYNPYGTTYTGKK